MSAAEDQPEPIQASSNARRTNTACIKCRERKVRCSGGCPCTNCVRRSAECVFEPDERKVLVSERYLNELKRKAEGIDSGSQNPPKRQAVVVPNAHHDTHENGLNPAHPSSSDKVLPNLKNPLASTPSKFVTDYQGRRRFLGPSSTWAYSQHVMTMIRNSLDQHQSPNLPLNTDGAAFAFELPSATQFSITEMAMDSLPSRDYALYLCNTVKFHICQTYHLFDEQSFMQGLNSLYSNGAQHFTAQNRLWYVQYFVIMAYGKALLMRGSSQANPYGCDYFSRAMQLLPAIDGLYKDPITAVEICCGLALYFQSVDHRNSAYVYLGIALRIALSQGMHRELVGEMDDLHDAARHRSAWWTLYILDRKFSSTMGAPSSIQDTDITVALPTPHQSIQASTALDVHVKLSRLIAKVINTIYGIDGQLDSSFLQNLRLVLRELASLAAELNQSPDFKFDNKGPISRVAATLNLCYHQCIILATRPLLMCLLRDKLEHHASGDKDIREVVGPIKAFLKTSCDSASKSLSILAALQSQDLLEMFLPFDLDTAFSAGFVLTLVFAIQPSQEILQDTSHLQTALSIIDCLISGGNIPAGFRREELERLHEMVLLVTQHQGSARPESTVLALDHPDLTAYGVSPNQMMSVAELLDGYPMGDGSLVDNNWLWEDDMALPSLDQTGASQSNEALT